MNQHFCFSELAHIRESLVLAMAFEMLYIQCVNKDGPRSRFCMHNFFDNVGDVCSDHCSSLVMGMFDDGVSERFVRILERKN